MSENILLFVIVIVIVITSYPNKDITSCLLHPDAYIILTHWQLLQGLSVHIHLRYI